MMDVVLWLYQQPHLRGQAMVAPMQCRVLGMVMI